MIKVAITNQTRPLGGDDKVICAGAPAAHDEALNFLTELSE